MGNETGIFQSIGDRIAQWWVNLDVFAILWDIGSIVLVIMATRILDLVIKKIIARLVLRGKIAKDERKAHTLQTLSISIVHYAIWFLCVVTILGILGLGATLSSLLATAGIGGLAIGLGAQSLLKDVITGFFMLFDDQFGVGDLITIDDTTGTVEALSIRTTSLRIFSGELVIIPNGRIGKVSNQSRGTSLAVVDCQVASEADVKRALIIMERVARAFEGDEALLGPPTVLGVTQLGLTQLGQGQAQLRMVANTKALQHWGIERAMRLRLIEEMTKEGVSMSARTSAIANRRDEANVE